MMTCPFVSVARLRRSFLAAVRLALAVAVLAASAHVAEAQTAAESAPVDAPAQSAPARWQFLVANGNAISTGAQRAIVKGGPLTAVQFSYAVRPMIALTTTVGWARRRDLALSDAKLDVFTYDVGAELRASAARVARGVTVSPLLGVGVGARSYNRRGIDRDTTHHVSAYLSAGGELGVRRVRLRVEARGYVTGARARNDVAILTGLRLVR